MANGNSTALTRTERAAIIRALAILKRRLDRKTPALDSSSMVRDFLTLRLAGERVEVFCAVWLDAQSRVIKFEDLFRGTVTQTSVYPREVVYAALQCNAASVIFAHNHPSGVAEPSRADEVLTQALKRALELIDVRVLDHFVIGSGYALSFSEKGLLQAAAEAPRRRSRLRRVWNRE